MRAAAAIALLAATAAAPGPAASPPAQPLPVVTDWRQIVLHPGINRIPGFLSEGRDATIVEAWRGNGNAHGWHDWLVLDGIARGEPVSVVPAEDGQPGDAIRDDPFDGERVLGAVRFARGRVGGRVRSLLVEARLEASPSGVLADHATATIKLFALQPHPDGAAGEPRQSFVLLGTAHTIGRYCNVHLAVRDTLGLPLPAGFAGFNRVDGCWHDGG